MKCKVGRKPKYKYAMGASRIYSIWNNMNKRCSSPNRLDYKYYGGRGITVCTEWLDFDRFCEDMLPSYSNDLTLDRIDTNGNYCKENCRWASMKSQTNNKRCNIKNDLGEVAADVSRRLGGTKDLIAVRIRVQGWDKERAFNTPVITTYRKGRFTKECEVCSTLLKPTNKYNNDKRKRCMRCRFAVIPEPIRKTTVDNYLA